MIIRIAQQIFCRLHDKNRVTNTKIGQKRHANGRRLTQIRHKRLNREWTRREKTSTADERRYTQIGSTRGLHGCEIAIGRNCADPIWGLITNNQRKTRKSRALRWCHDRSLQPICVNQHPFYPEEFRGCGSFFVFFCGYSLTL